MGKKKRRGEGGEEKKKKKGAAEGRNKRHAQVALAHRRQEKTAAMKKRRRSAKDVPAPGSEKEFDPRWKTMAVLNLHQEIRVGVKYGFVGGPRRNGPRHLLIPAGETNSGALGSPVKKKPVVTCARRKSP